MIVQMKYVELYIFTTMIHLLLWLQKGCEGGLSSRYLKFQKTYFFMVPR